MKNTRQLMRRAQELFRVDYVPAHVNRHNRKSWCRAIIRLGDKWLLAQSIDRSTYVKQTNKSNGTPI